MLQGHADAVTHVVIPVADVLLAPGGNEGALAVHLVTNPVPDVLVALRPRPGALAVPLQVNQQGRLLDADGKD